MKTTILAALAVLSTAGPALAQGELNVYSSRHYDSDDNLYALFTEQTGIAVNRIEDEADILIERIRSEGELGAADVFITVDAGRLARADDADVFQPLEVAAVEEKVPANLRTEDWTALSTRARIIFYDRQDVTEPPRTYAELADPVWRGKVCTRSSSNVYMQSLLASIIVNEGEAAARAWAEGVLANLARDPAGGDTDQLTAIVSGECDVVLSNHYYFARMLAQGDAEAKARIGVVWPNQETNGTHVNVSGIGIVKTAPNAQNARRFVEFVLSDEAQKLIADQNFEYPVVDGVEASQIARDLGAFAADEVAIGEIAGASAAAQRIYDEVGYP